MDKKEKKMNDWTQTLTVIGIMVAMLSIFAGLMVYFFNKVDNHMTKIEGRLNSHSARIDMLYQMFVDLLKDERRR